MTEPADAIVPVESVSIVRATEETDAVLLCDSRTGSQVMVRASELRRLAVAVDDALAIFDRQPFEDPSYPKNEQELRRQYARLRDQNRLLGERLRQLEGVVQGAFARAVKGLSGDHAKARQGADQAVRIIDDHTRAQQLLRSAGIQCESVAYGVKRLIEDKERYVVEERAWEQQARRAEAERGIAVDTAAGDTVVIVEYDHTSALEGAEVRLLEEPKGEETE